MLFFTNFLAYKIKTPPSCYLDGATEIILLNKKHSPLLHIGKCLQVFIKTEQQV